MSDEIETIDRNPKSWAAWKREAERLQKIIDGIALAAMDSEPVTVPEHITYISEPTILNILANDDSSPMANAARLLAYEVRFWRSFPLYRHAQPAPVIPDRSIFEKWWESQNGAPLDGWDSLRTTDGYCDDGIDWQFEAWNAAMLAAAPQEVKGD